MLDLLITGGMVASAESTSVLDVAVAGGKIQALAAPGTFGSQAQKIVDARRKYVMPGAIDPHTHLYSQFEGIPVPAPTIQSIAAAHGGTTTFIDFARINSREGVVGSLRKRLEDFEGKSAIDYTVHGILSDPAWELIPQLRDAFAIGIPSLKIDLHARHGQPPDDGFVLASLTEIARIGGIMGFHAENQGLIDYYTRDLLAQNKTGVQFFPDSRPNIVEAEAVRRMIYLAERAGARGYFFHLSCREAVKEVAFAKARGLPIYAETCPHYLAFNDEEYRGERAIQFVRFPSIKSALDQEALWQGVIDGAIDSIGTDHVTALLSIKRSKSEGKPFTDIPGGMAQVETRLPFMFSEGVAKGRISINRLVALVATNPAKLFGLYPRKGAILPGSDADIVVLDPGQKKKITSGELHMGLDYTVFEGWTFAGTPSMTIAKGKVIIEDGKFLGSVGQGEFLRGSIDPNVLNKA